MWAEHVISSRKRVQPPKMTQMPPSYGTLEIAIFGVSGTCMWFWSFSRIVSLTPPQCPWPKTSGQNVFESQFWPRNTLQKSFWHFFETRKFWPKIEGTCMQILGPRFCKKCKKLGLLKMSIFGKVSRRAWKGVFRPKFVVEYVFFTCLIFKSTI